MRKSGETLPEDDPQKMPADQAVVRAYRLWNAGRHAEAEFLCRRVLKSQPEHAGALHLLGLIALASRNLSQAIVCIKKACAAPDAPPQFYSNLAEVLRQDGRLDEAEAAARQALARKPDLVPALTNLGIILQEAGRFEDSLATLTQAAARAPASAELHNNLGNTLKCLGRTDEAETEYRNALTQRPNYPEAHNNLAYLYDSLGRYEAALAEILRAIDIHPHFVPAYIHAATIALDRHDGREALRWLDNLAGFAAGLSAAANLRVRALLLCEREEDALSAARRAVADAPENGEAREMLARALAATGAGDEALAVFDEAAALPSPHPAAAHLGKAMLLTRLGRDAEALTALTRAMACEPHSGRAMLPYANARTFAADDPECARMERVLTETGAGDRENLLRMHFALGKACRDGGDFDRAFAHYAEGCRLKRETVDYDGAADARRMAEIAATFTPALLERFAGAGDPSPVPVFVIGMPGPAPIYLERLLAAHPAIARGTARLQRIAEKTLGPDRKPAGFPRMATKLSPSAAADLGRTCLARLRRRAPQAERIVDGTPENIRYAGLIHMVLPQAKILHIRRDALDSCLSCYATLFESGQSFSYDLTELGRYCRACETLMAHWRAVLPAETLYDISYEDLSGDPAGVAQRVLDFIGLDRGASGFGAPPGGAAIGDVGCGKNFAAHLGPLAAELAGDDRCQR